MFIPIMFIPIMFIPIMFIPRLKFGGKVRGIWERGEGKYRCAFYVVAEKGRCTGGCVISMRWVCGAQE